MISHLIQVGNSKGVRLPKFLLKQCNIENEISIIVDKSKIIIEPIGSSSRKNWHKEFAKLHKQEDNNHKQEETYIESNFDKEDWIW